MSSLASWGSFFFFDKIASWVVSCFAAVLKSYLWADFYLCFVALRLAHQSGRGYASPKATKDIYITCSLPVRYLGWNRPSKPT